MERLGRGMGKDLGTEVAFCDADFGGHGMLGHPVHQRRAIDRHAQVTDKVGGQFRMREGCIFFGGGTLEDLPYGIDRRLVRLLGVAAGQGVL